MYQICTERLIFKLQVGLEALRDGVPLGAHVQLASWWRCCRPETELLISGTNDNVVGWGWEVRWGLGRGLELPGRLKDRTLEPAPWIAGFIESYQVQEGSKANSLT